MKNRKYKSVGFVEALIAIAVAGIASVVLMGIAADTYAQVLYNEMADQMTEISLEGSEIVKKVADEHNKADANLFPPIGGSYCYTFTGDLEDPSFVTDGNGNFESVCTYDSGRGSCLNSLYEGSDEYFTIFCMTTESEYDNNLVVGKVVTGMVDCDGTNRSGKCVNGDYEYYMAVKVIQGAAQ